MQKSISMFVRCAVVIVCVFAMAACDGGGGTSQAPSVVTSPVTWFIPGGTTQDATLTATQFDSGQLYFNVLSASNAAGEIRGAITPSATVYQLDTGDPFAANPSNLPVTFSAVLNGDQVRPRYVVSSANGYGSVTLNPLTKQLTGFVVTSGIAGASAQIQDGLPGVGGSTVLALEGGPVVWTVPASTLLSDAQIARLKAGAYYFNITSSAFPAGEIRGQLDQQVRSATLNGSNEVPPVVTTATAVGVLAMKAATNQFSGFVRLTGFSTPVASVILVAGAAGTNGTIVVALENHGNGIWALPIDTVLSASQVASFNSDQLYYNVITGSGGLFAGEVRGQLLKSSIKLGTAALDGSKEVPQVATQGTGSGIVALNTLTGELYGSVNTVNMTGTQARIHSGASNANGPALVSMTTSSPVTTTPKAGVSFALDIQPIFTASCSSVFCHVTGGIAPMSLQPGVAYGQAILRVVPGNPSASYLFQKLAGSGATLPTTPGSLMPLAGAPLSTTSLSLIRDWITAGARNN